MIWFILTIFALVDISDVITSIDIGWFNVFRVWFSKLRIGKLIHCQSCQLFWLSLIVSLLALLLPTYPLILKIVVLWLALHKLTLIFQQFCERYVGGAPLNIFVHHRKAQDE